MKEIGYIYIIKNYKNNKVYIGQTTQDVEKRFNQHLKCSKSNKNQLIYFLYYDLLSCSTITIKKF